MRTHFYGMPTRRDGIGISRFKPHPARHWTTFNAGELVPIWVKEMLPGDNRVVFPSFVVRSQTPIRPVMDDAFLDVFAFYVPNRIVWDHWINFMGENTTSYWVEDQTYRVPQLQSAGSVIVGFQPGSVADHMGLATKIGGKSVSQLPFRGYVKIWNEYFRDQNLMSPAACPTNDTNVQTPTTSAVYSDPWQSAYRGCTLLPVCRIPDYFSTCTPGPLKSTSQVSLRLSDVPVLDNSAAIGGLPSTFEADSGLLTSPKFFIKNAGGTSFDDATGKALGTIASPNLDDSHLASRDAGDGESYSDQTYTALKAMVSTSGISINDLRFAVQLQKLLERDLFGTRYYEILQSHFGVKNPDARLQRPELYAWQRFRLNQNQVVQTSATGSTGTPQGNVSAYSLTVGVPRKFHVPSPEHGFLIVCACIRVVHSYQQNIERFWTRKDRYDFYWNEFQGLGNQPVYTQELYAGADPDQVFGFQEYAADYRFNVNLVTGQMRSNATGTLDSWHYADKYDSVPYLSSAWIQDNSKALIDRTLAVPSSSADQFFGVFDFGGTLDTEVPLYSIPGYVDHF